MDVIIKALNDKGLKAIKKISEEKHKYMTLEDDKLIIKIPIAIAPALRLIQRKTGVLPQYGEFIKSEMKKAGASENDYNFEVV